MNKILKIEDKFKGFQTCDEKSLVDNERNK